MGSIQLDYHGMFIRNVTKLGEIISESFIECGSVQCGFCIPAMLVTAYSLIMENDSMSRDEIREGMAGVICRCTGYQKIIDGVILASEKYRKMKRDSERRGR